MIFEDLILLWETSIYGKIWVYESTFSVTFYKIEYENH